MAILTLIRRPPDASVNPCVPIEALANGNPGVPGILPLGLGQRTGWAVRNHDGAIAGGTHQSWPGRLEGGGMIWLRVRSWPQEIDQTSGGIDLAACAEANRTPYRGVPVGAIKRHLTGKGNADKQRVIDAVRRLGFNRVDVIAADALALTNGAISSGLGVVR